MVLKAREKATERRAWEMWLTFDSRAKESEPWDEYLKRYKKPPEQKDNRTEEEIMQDAENILKSMGRT